MLGGMGTLAGMAALGALAEHPGDKDEEEERPRRSSPRREKALHKRAARSSKAGAKEASEQRYTALRALFVFAAVAIAV